QRQTGLEALRCDGRNHYFVPVPLVRMLIECSSKRAVGDQSAHAHEKGYKQAWKDGMGRLVVFLLAERGTQLMGFIPSPRSIIRAPGRTSSVWQCSLVEKGASRRDKGWAGELGQSTRLGVCRAGRVRRSAQSRINQAPFEERCERAWRIVSRLLLR